MRSCSKCVRSHVTCFTSNFDCSFCYLLKDHPYFEPKESVVKNCKGCLLEGCNHPCCGSCRLDNHSFYKPAVETKVSHTEDGFHKVEEIHRGLSGCVGVFNHHPTEVRDCPQCESYMNDHVGCMNCLESIGKPKFKFSVNSHVERILKTLEPSELEVALEEVKNLKAENEALKEKMEEAQWELCDKYKQQAKEALQKNSDLVAEVYYKNIQINELTSSKESAKVSEEVARLNKIIDRLLKE